jgi:hypothetical protein
MGKGGSFPGVKRPGREAVNSRPSSAEVFQYVFLAWYLIKHRENFTFAFESVRHNDMHCPSLMFLSGCLNESYFDNIFIATCCYQERYASV